MQYYDHADHLGSSSYITNLDAQIVQHVEYVPFGEVFIEERNQSWNTPYLFNGKELDEETGLYYYGARYYNPRESIFLSVDPMFEETMTPYQYTYQNPIRFTDPTGMSPDGWIEQIGEDGSKTYTYRSDINTVAEAEAAGFNNVSRVSDRFTLLNDTYGYRYDLNSNGTYTLTEVIFSSTVSVYDSETFTTRGGSTITGYKCTTCPTIDRPIATNSIQYQMGSASGQLGVAAYYGLQTFSGIVAGEALLGTVGLGGGLSFSGYAAAGDALGGLGVRTLPVTNALSYDARIALQTDLYHSFPNSFDTHIINNGSWSQRIKDGANWYEISGSINGEKGNFQIGLTHWNKVFHKNFKPVK